MPGFIQIMDNPDGGPDNKEAKWWKSWLGKKKETHDKNEMQIEVLRKEQFNLHIQQQSTNTELRELCKKYDELVKQLAAEGRAGLKSEHRRLEVDED